jgi:hypothetical protein
MAMVDYRRRWATLERRAASPLAGLKDAMDALTKSGYNALFSGIQPCSMI